MHLTGVRGIHGIEERRERVAQAEAAAAAVADVEDALQLLGERRFVVEGRIAPIDGMARGCLEAALAACGGLPWTPLAGTGRCRGHGMRGVIGARRERRAPSASWCFGIRDLKSLRGPSGTGWRASARPWPGSRTSRRSRRNLHRALPSPS